MIVSCSHCQSVEVDRVARHGLWDMLQNLLGKWPYVCRACGKPTYSEHRTNSKQRASQRFAPEPSLNSTVNYAAKRQGPNAAVVIRAESDHQLTNILLALSRAVETEQMASTSTKSHSTAP